MLDTLLGKNRRTLLAYYGPFPPKSTPKPPEPKVGPLREMRLSASKQALYWLVRLCGPAIFDPGTPSYYRTLDVVALGSRYRSVVRAVASVYGDIAVMDWLRRAITVTKQCFLYLLSLAVPEEDYAELESIGSPGFFDVPAPIQKPNQRSWFVLHVAHQP